MIEVPPEVLTLSLQVAIMQVIIPDTIGAAT